MDSFNPRKAKGPEAIIQDAIVAMLRSRLWYVMETHGSMFQSGLPDIFCTHANYGFRWIEVKRRSGSRLTPAQKVHFPQIVANGCPIYFLYDATDSEYQKLFKPTTFKHDFLALT